MKIAVISDIHDGLENLTLVLKEIEIQGIENIICCGDLVSPFIAKELGKSFRGDVYCVAGTDEELSFNPMISHEYPNFHDLGEVGELELDGKKIGFVHYPEIAETMATGGVYDFVFYGHTHTPFAEMVRECLLLNPGEVLGGRHPTSYAIVDLDTKVFNFFPI